MATKRVTAGTAKVTLVERNEARSALLIANSHATAVIYVTDDGDVSLTSGFPLQPKTALLLSREEGVEVEKKLLVISDTATTYVHVWECFKRVEKEKPEKPDIQEPGALDPGM